VALALPALLFARTDPPSAAQVIAIINAQRAANGIPAPIAENPAWSSGCSLHLGYMERNNVFTHGENPDNPGYTAAGAWAGTNSVLAQNVSFAHGTDPFNSSPLHLAALMNPFLTTTGAADNGHDVCVAVTALAAEAPAVPSRRFWSVPGDGRKNVRVAERAHEEPFVPGEQVGLPAGTLTGPYLIVYPGVGFTDATHVAAASLRAADGTTVPLRTVDPGQLGAYAGNFVFLIPVDPLEHGMRYTATAHLVDPTTRNDSVDSFSFTTAAGPKVALSVPPVRRPH
jgi:hypothetical protein